MTRLTILTGACGSGKTTIARAFADRYPELAEVHFFDAIGVPSPEDMIRDYGSAEEWQRQKTIEWIAKLAAAPASRPNVLLEGQMRLRFIREGQRLARVHEVRIMLADCDDATRTQRLTDDRSQPELVCEQTMNWARFLRDEAEQEGAIILDTSRMSVEEAVDALRARVDPRYRRA